MAMERIGRRKWIRRILCLGIAAVAVPAITIALARLKPAAPLVEGGSIWSDEVKRGPMLRRVPGLGTLAAEEILFVPTVTDGRVKRIHYRPGATVATVATTEAEFAVKGAEAKYIDLRVQLNSQMLTQRAKVARIESEHQQAKLQAGRDEALFKQALTAEFNGTIPGRVSRIDPAATEGTIMVDVRLEGALPNGARPDLSVDGTIEIEKLADGVYVGRPAFGQPHSTVSMFKLDQDGKGATRVQVKLGRSSVNTIEVVEDRIRYRLREREAPGSV